MFRRLVLLTLSLAFVLPALLPRAVSAAQLLDRSLKLADNRASVTTNWEFGFRFSDPDSVATISLQVCANNPYPGDTCTVPTGLDVSDATLTSQSGNTGFAVSPSSTGNRIILERAGAVAAPVLSTYRLSGITNPDSDGSYYVRVETYQNSYISGPSNNYGGIAFAITRNVNITATVPPYLLFCVGVTVGGFDCNNVVGNFVDFGEFNSRQASQGRTQMLAASNALNGYTIRVAGPTMTSGNNEIAALVGSDISRPGTAQFGMNLRANGSPQGGQDVAGSGAGVPTNGYNQINQYRFNNGDVVAISNAPDLARKYTTTYVVNVPRTQASGIYVTTLTYVALGSY